jgi:serine/threonine protein kinase
MCTKSDEIKDGYILCGTPGYIAPEIFQSNMDKIYNNSSDIFSLGVIFYYLYLKVCAIKF